VTLSPMMEICAGVLLSREELERAAELTARAGAWLVMDNTYEHFVYEGLQHHCISGPHIIHLFSFSKVGKTPLKGSKAGCPWIL
jgi:aspartate/methionine/tyrosine aminotransferase